MAILCKNLDIFAAAHSAAQQGQRVLLLAAVNQSRTRYDGREINWRTEWYHYGSMSAGTSLQLVNLYPGVAQWWAQKVRDSQYLEGVHIYDTVYMGLDVGVAVIKDHWWQEGEKDKGRIMHFARRALAQVKVLADSYGKICVPLLGAGYGKIKVEEMLALVEEMELPGNVEVYYLTK